MRLENTFQMVQKHHPRGLAQWPGRIHPRTLALPPGKKSSSCSQHLWPRVLLIPSNENTILPLTLGNREPSLSAAAISSSLPALPQNMKLHTPWSSAAYLPFASPSAWWAWQAQERPQVSWRTGHRVPDHSLVGEYWVQPAIWSLLPQEKTRT